jgi:predicted SAM-dependent methyltransferase
MGPSDAAQRQSNQRALLKQIQAEKDIRLVVGAGGLFEAGWIPTDLNTLDLTRGADWAALFQPGSIEVILAEHVWEHLTPEQSRTALRYCHQYLKPGGRIRIAVPDGYHPDSAYHEYVRPGGTGPGADDHKILYTYETLSAALQEGGFVAEKLEHFNESGVFSRQAWEPRYGTVRRSALTDQRNSDGVLRYTSLIMDGIKPV